MQGKTFEEIFEDYEKKLKEMTGGLIKAERSDLVRMLAFFEAVERPIFEETFKEIARSFRKG